MYFLYLDRQAWIFLFNSIANCVILILILLILVSHQIIPILYGLFYLFLCRFHEIEFHYDIILELRVPNDIQLPFVLRKYRKGTYILISGPQPLEIFDDEIRVLSKFDKEVLISFDSFEFPVIALKYEVEIDLGIAG